MIHSRCSSTHVIRPHAVVSVSWRAAKFYTGLSAEVGCAKDREMIYSLTESIWGQTPQPEVMEKSSAQKNL